MSSWSESPWWNRHQWKTWKHGNGMTSCYREHLKQKHSKIYEETRRILNLKHADELTGASSPECAPFKLEMFYHLLMKWVVADDQVSYISWFTVVLWWDSLPGPWISLQSMNVLKCQEFWELLLHLGKDRIDKGELPHRTKMTLMILEEFKAEHERIRNNLQVCYCTI